MAELLWFSRLNLTKVQIENAVGKVYPALVRIYVVVYECMEGREQKFQGAGSGTIISPDGYVVTNHHVVGKAKYIRCTLADKEEVEAELVGTDALADIAIIKLKPETMKNPVKEFPYAEFGDSSKLKIGDPVFAMGSPLAFLQSVTLGIVSNTEMIFSIFSGGEDALKLDGEAVGSLVRWIQHDALILPGNSGGPLVNMEGKVIGVNEIGFGGLGGSIPASIAHTVSAEIIKNGEVRRSWIGMDFAPLLKSSGLEQGVLVEGVISGSPAEKAGLKPSDILLSYDGNPVSVRWDEDSPIFNRMILETPIGKTVKVEILRAGEKTNLQITTIARGKVREDEKEVLEWGATFRDITPLGAKELKRDTTDGILVTSIRAGGPCGQAKPEIASLDIIVSIGGRPVKNLAGLKAITAEIVKDKDKIVPTIVGFERKNQKLLTVVRIGLSEEENNVPNVKKACFLASVQVFSSDLAEAMGIGDKKGVIITQIFPNSPVEKAGFKVGDIITQVNGMEIKASDPADLRVFPNMIRQFPIGSKVEMTTIRNGKETKMQVELAETPAQENQMKKHKDAFFGFTAREMAFNDRVSEKLESEQNGLYISAVEPACWAELARMRVGDVLLSVNDSAVNDIDIFKKVMGKIEREKPKHIVFFVRRGIHTRYLEIEIDWNLSK
ncbi:MAG: PDZ domain-containing protein [Planctomycetota bacterium]